MRMGEVAYRLMLPTELTGVHKVFHVSMLKRYVPEPSYVLHHEPLDVQPDTTFVEKTKKIIDMKERALRTRAIHWVKVQWEHYSPRETAWELKDQVKDRYLDLLLEVRLSI